MKNTIGLAVLAVVAIGLAVTLFITKRNATDQNTRAQDTILNLSNSWESTSAELASQKSVNAALEKDLTAKKQETVELTNKLVSVRADLAKTESNLAKTESALATTREEVVKRDTRITELETANAELDKQADSLSQSITNLTELIASTRQKLATSEGNR